MAASSPWCDTSHGKGGWRHAGTVHNGGGVAQWLECPEFQSEEPEFDTLAGQGEDQFFCPSGVPVGFFLPVLSTGEVGKKKCVKKTKKRARFVTSISK